MIAEDGEDGQAEDEPVGEPEGHPCDQDRGPGADELPQQPEAEPAEEQFLHERRHER